MTRARRRLARALRQQPRAARRGRAVRQDLADLQLSLRAQPRGAGAARARTRRPGRLPRLEAAVHQPAHRRRTPCRPSRAFIQLLPQGLRARSPTAPPTAPCTRSSKAAASATHRRRELRASSRATPSSCRRGMPLHARGRRARACCSPSPTGRRRKRWASGGKSGDERDRTRPSTRREYNNRELVPDHAQYFARWAARTRRARAHHDLPPRPALRRRAGRDASTSSRRARATAAA